MLEVRNIAFSYSRRAPLLRDVSFVVSPGEIVSVLGANGAGKTTLVKVLATLFEPDSGKVIVDGQDALSHVRRYRHQLGYLPEKVALYDDMTAREYLRYRAELKGEPAKRVRRRVGEAAEICRITEWLDKSLARLSTGIRKRVALADAMLLRPRVLLLDDFLAGLDRGMRQTAGAVLSDVAAFSSVIVTGHEVASFASWTTRFLVLRGGVIASSVATAGVSREDILARVDATLKGGEA